LKWAEHRENNIPIKYPNELRVLSIDGGGIKGIIPIIYLKRIEKQLGASIHNFFDMICGTSTGGIIALGLAAGISATEISEIYKKKVGEIPPQKLFRNNVFSSKYSNKSLLKLLKSTYADKKIADANTMLCIPAIEHHKAKPKVYKNAPSQRISL